MKIALIVSSLVASLALNAQTLQGKVVRVADGDAITLPLKWQKPLVERPARNEDKPDPCEVKHE